MSVELPTRTNLHLIDLPVLLDGVEDGAEEVPRKPSTGHEAEDDIVEDQGENSSDLGDRRKGVRGALECGDDGGHEVDRWTPDEENSADVRPCRYSPRQTFSTGWRWSRRVALNGRVRHVEVDAAEGWCGWRRGGRA